MKSKTRICGGLCLASIIITAIVCLTFKGPLEAKGQSSHTANSSFTQSYWPLNWLNKEEAEPTKLVVVVRKNCAPCRQLKLYTVPVLLAEGYDVTVLDKRVWNEENPKNKVTSIPVLFYMAENNKIIRKQAGFKTAYQVKKYLKKVQE